MTSSASLVLDMVERVWNGGDLDALSEFYAPTFDHDDGPGDIEQLVQWHRDHAATWAGVTYSVRDCVATDDRVALRWLANAIHVGPWGPVPTTGRRVEWGGAHFFRVEDERIVAVHSMSDRFGTALQLGVSMTPPS